MEAFLIITFLIIGATSFQKEDSSTVLLSNNGKKESSIVIKTKNEELTISTPENYVDLTINKASKIKKMPKEEFNKRFGNLVKSEPKEPTTILLYFKNKNTLTDSSKDKLDLIFKEIKKRKLPDLLIISHTDTVGSEELNVKVSLQRAKFVKELILKENVKLHSLDISSHGESDLLIKTADNVSEEKNRRVEVIIK